MTLYGMISVITPFINPNKQRWMGNTSDFLTEKIFGKRQLNIFRNLFWGIICFILGVAITIMYGKQLIN